MTYTKVDPPEQDDALEREDLDEPVIAEPPAEPPADTDTTDRSDRPTSAARQQRGVTRETLVGGLSVAGITIAGLHQVAGIPGLIAGGAAVTAGGASYVAYRYRRPRGRDHSGRRGADRSTTASPSTSGGRRTKLGKSAGSVGSALRSLGGRGGGGGGRRRGLFSGNSGGSGRSGRSGRSPFGGGKTPKAKTRAFDRAVRKAFDRADRKKGKQGKQANTRTAHRISQIWAARPRLAVRERFSAWDAEMTSGLRALVAKVLRWLGLAPEAPAAAENEEEAKDQTKEEAKTESDAGPEAAPAAESTPPEPPRPTTTSGIRITPRSTAPMSTNPLVVASAELIPAAAGWGTEDMMIAAAHLKALHEVPFNTATALGILTDRLYDDYPIDRLVLEALRDLYTDQSKLITKAEGVSTLFSNVHRAEILRREKPRRGERKWNHPGA
ncbi:hypothetical protein [Streptosporangium sp. NPDC002524]|uniref:hypothetical protein n=1 Tax=Streptosporangium sp. NPDC002524 TaxID=3154537 RepID=UPI00331B4913